MTPFDIYLWLKLDDFQASLSACFILFGVIGLIVAIGCIGGYVCETNKPRIYVIVAFAIIPLFGWFCGLLYTALPSTKQMAAIIVAPKIINSEVVQKDIPDLYEMGLELVKEKIAEATGKEVAQ